MGSPDSSAWYQTRHEPAHETSHQTQQDFAQPIEEWIAQTEAGLMHGDVNAHTHLYSGLAPLGLPSPTVPPQSFPQILQRIWWRLDRALDEASLRAAARLYVAESLLAGTTALFDHHESPLFIAGSLDVLADVCQGLGMRALLCYGATDRNGGPSEGEAGLAECERFVRSNRRPLVRGLCGLHASFTVSDATVQRAGDLCRRLQVPLHVHMAEDRCDVTHAQATGNAGPLQRLQQLSALPAGSILAHGVHLQAEEVRRADALGLWLVHNPRSNHANGVGYAHSLRHSTHVALGTDGFPADMAQEKAALRQYGPPDSDADLVADQRLQAGREILRQHFTDADLATDQVMRDSTGRVHSVRVGGRLVVENGRLLCDDLDAIRSDAAREAARLWQRMRAVPE